MCLEWSNAAAGKGKARSEKVRGGWYALTENLTIYHGKEKNLQKADKGAYKEFKYLNMRQA